MITKNMKGFTLLELIMTLAIAAIVVTIGIPSFSSFVKQNRMTTQINDFVSSVNIARSESVKRSRHVQVCKSNNGTSCDTSTVGWEQGWITFVDEDRDRVVSTGDTIITVHGALQAGMTLTGNVSVQDSFYYTTAGHTNLSSYGDMILCDAKGDSSRAISITGPGRIEKLSAADSSLTC